MSRDFLDFLSFIGYNLFIRVLCYGVPFVLCYFVLKLWIVWAIVIAVVSGYLLVKILFFLNIFRIAVGKDKD